MERKHAVDSFWVAQAGYGQGWAAVCLFLVIG